MKEDWIKTKKRVTEQVLACSAFDDIAPIAVFLHADLKYDQQLIKNNNVRNIYKPISAYIY